MENNTSQKMNTKKENTMGKISLVFGILGLILSSVIILGAWFGFFYDIFIAAIILEGIGLIGFLGGVIGLIVDKKKEMAIVGILVSIMAIAGGFFCFRFFGFATWNP